MAAAPTPTPKISRPTIIMGTQYDAAMTTAPTVKLKRGKLFQLRFWRRARSKNTHKASAMTMESFLPILSDRVPRMRAPKIAPMVVAAVMISCSEAESACPRSSPTMGRADPTMA